MIRKLVVTMFVVLAVALIAGCGPSPPPNLVHTLDDLNGRVIGAIAGTPSERLANEFGIAQSFASGDELIYHLLAGTIDCVIVESSVAAELVSAHSRVRLLGEPLLVYDLRFAVAIENRELLRAVNEALATLRANGTLRGLSDMYFSGRRFTYVPPEDVIRRPGYLSLAVSAYSPPFSFRNEHGYFSGLDIDVARAVCDLLGVELMIIEYDAWELVRAVRYGRADLALGWLPGEGDEQLINISEPYAIAEHVVVVRR
ncbi:MAG: transporter substrate-binding domain-containing protein [Oscillospiraceae bacterium]|nr:transporter substrate-binding domain-containing protein [Oscillospiraceae bacterium]